MNLVVFLPNWIGDTVMATPTLRALRQHVGPQGRIIGVLRPYVADVLAGTHWLDEQILFDPKSAAPERRTWPVIRQLRALQPDSVLLLTNSFRTAAMAWASGARRRVGYARYGRDLLLTDRVYPTRQHGQRVPTPEIDSYIRLAATLGSIPDSRRLELGTTAADRLAADAVWAKWKLPSDRPVVVLNSGGAYGAAKLWPTEYFAELARRLAADDGLPVLAVCGPNERPIAAEIVRRANHPSVVSLADEPVSIGLTKECVRRSGLMVTTDSGPRFFGAAFGLPVVALFGPTDPRWSTTYAAGEVCLTHDLSCRPCQQRTCPLGHHRCLRDLSVDRVHEAVRRQLKTARPAAA